MSDRRLRRIVSDTLVTPAIPGTAEFAKMPNNTDAPDTIRTCDLCLRRGNAQQAKPPSEEQSNDDLFLVDSNMVALTGDKTVQPAPVGKSSNIRIAEVGRAILNVLTLFEDFEPAAVPLPADSRIFEIDGKLPGESDVKAGNAKLHVVVLKGRLVKIAIRPVQVRDDNGQVVAHAEGKFDIPALVATMNQIWTVQSNVVFELVSADPILVADEVAIARAMDLKAERAKLPREVNMVDFAAMFDGFRDKKADFTFFLVHRVLDRKKGESGHGLTVTGASSRLFPVSLIGDDMNVSTIAHEAGHLLGFKGHSDTGPRMLMNEGGPGVGLGKIPLSWAKSFNAGIK